jgi:hypothetical protein
MSDTFNDGDPIDAALLQRLKTEVAKATALASAKAVAGSNINAGGVNNQTDPADTTPRTFFGGKTKTIKLVPGARATFDIDYSGAGFQANPSAITLTPVSPDKSETMGVPSIISGTVTKTGARGQILGMGLEKKITIYFIAVQNQG